MVAPVPEASVGFTVVADKDRKEDGGGALEEEAQQGQLQSPARGAAGRPGHGTGAASLRRGCGSGRVARADTPGAGGAGRFRASRAPPTEPGPAHHEEARQGHPARAQLPVRVPGSGASRGRRGPGPGREEGRGVGEGGAFAPPSPLSFGPADPDAVPVGTGPWK